MDLDSDDGDDGGVRIDDYLEVSVAETIDNNLNIRARYYQDAAHIYAEPGEMLWQLPVPPIIGGKKSKLRNAHGLHYAFEVAYHHDCNLICKRWNCHPSEMLPARLAISTPYSFTMLAILRRLATHTRDVGRDVAHTMLLEQVAHRLYGQQYPADVKTTSAREAMSQTDRHPLGEDQIVERVDGLMIEDVYAVRKRVSATKTLDRKARRAQGNPKAAESKRVARERLLASRLASKDGMNMKATSMRGSQAVREHTPYAVWRAEIAPRHEYALEQRKPAHSGMVTEFQDAMADADPTLISPRRQDQELTRLARRVFAAENEERRDKKKAHRSATSLARSKQATNTLPSERFDFTTLPTLASATESQKPSAKQAGAIQQQQLPGGASLVLPIHGLKIE